MYVGVCRHTSEVLPGCYHGGSEMTELIERDSDGDVDTGCLTPLQRRFADEYIKDSHPVRAAIRAGYSKGTATVHARKMVDNPVVRAAIKDAQEAQLVISGITGARVLQELANIAFVDIGDVCSWTSDGEVTIKSASEMKPRTRRAIKSITVTPGKDGNTVKVEMHDKGKALDKLTKVLGLETPLKVEAEIAGAALPPETSIRELIALAAAAKR
jgi:phage terminase small subunit